MKYVIILSLLSPLALAAGTVGHDALKSIPSNQLQGITVLSCEEKEPTSTVSCRSNGRCTITVVTGRVSCKAVRK